LVANADSKMNTVVIIGASYVRAWPIQEADGKKVLNKGVDGQQTFEMLQRFEQDVISVNPSAVIIWGFIKVISVEPQPEGWGAHGLSPWVAQTGTTANPASHRRCPKTRSSSNPVCR
jgi:hypothetical protein